MNNLEISRRVVSTVEVAEDFIFGRALREAAAV
jgi:hypothetical protein